MKKNILIFSLAYYPSFVSGAEAAIKEITDRIDPADFEFHLVTLLFDKNAPRKEVIGNVTVHRVGFGGAYLSKILFVPLAALKARTLHKTITLDGMWAMMTYMNFPLVLSRLIGVRVPYMITFQDGDSYEKVFNRWFIRPVAPIIDHGIKGASVIQVISNYLGTWPEKRGYTGEVVLVRNGANPKNFTQYYSDEELQAVKRELGKQDDDVYLFIAARLVYQKGIEAIIKALTKLPSNIHFIVGGDGGERQKLEDLATELGVSDRVRFLGQLERDDVPKYRNTIVSDIFVHPSRSEGLGNSVLSAMAARLPVIASNVGGLGDFVFDNKHNPDKLPTAWVVAPDAPDEIAAAVLDIIADTDKKNSVVTNARALVEAEYEWGAIAKKMQQEVFSKLV